MWRSSFAQRDLQDNFAFLRQKICLMALIEAVFKRPTSDRVLPFSVIAAETRIPANEVEHLVMKALSLNLIKGTLDQVASTTAISWVQPRVLDKAQIDALRARLADWTDKVTGSESGARGGSLRVWASGAELTASCFCGLQSSSSRRCRRPSCLCRKSKSKLAITTTHKKKKRSTPTLGPRRWWGWPASAAPQGTSHEPAPSNDPKYVADQTY